MGNGMSEEEESKFIEDAYKLSLDNPDVDKKVNLGTTAPNCQPKHTNETFDDNDENDEGGGNDVDDDGTEVVSSGSGKVQIQENEQRKRRQNRQSQQQQQQQGNKNDPKKLTYIQMAKIGYQELVNAIIRPPRADYKMEALGPPAFTFCGRRFTRTDFSLVTKRGMTLQCSHWEPVERSSDRIPCVIYMHGNSSARVEVIPQLSYLLCLGLAVFAFDFAGSGKSDGEHVSLGFYEREDLMCVIAHLRATNVVSTIALWGRSMGAATALMHGDRDPSIACMILDSPFADLTQLAEEMCEKGREHGLTVPNFVVSVAIRMIRGSVKRQANFDIKCISPIAHASMCFIPALFVAGEHDDFIHKRHSEAIHARYAGDKNIIVVEGDHNSPRPKFMFDSASIFLQTCLQIPSHWALRVHPGMNLMAPPWFFPGVVGSTPLGNTISPRKPTRRVRTAPQKKTVSEEEAAAAAAGGVEMGMTLERQKEIQASLFRMLGQADEPSECGNSAGEDHKSVESGGGNGLAHDASSTGTGSGVHHSTTFPPGSSSVASETVTSSVPSTDTTDRLL